MTQYVGLDVSIIETKLHVVDEAEPGEAAQSAELRSLRARPLGFHANDD